MNNRVKIKILSPLALFVVHLIYLVAWSPDPFLNKWIDGSFTLFIALVLCNVIRARVVAQEEQSAPAEDADSDPEDKDTSP